MNKKQSVRIIKKLQLQSRILSREAGIPLTKSHYILYKFIYEKNSHIELFEEIKNQVDSPLIRILIANDVSEIAHYDLKYVQDRLYKYTKLISKEAKINKYKSKEIIKKLLRWHSPEYQLKIKLSHDEIINLNLILDGMESIYSIPGDSSYYFLAEGIISKINKFNDKNYYYMKPPLIYFERYFLTKTHESLGFDNNITWTSTFSNIFYEIVAEGNGVALLKIKQCELLNVIIGTGKRTIIRKISNGESTLNCNTLYYESDSFTKEFIRKKTKSNFYLLKKLKRYDLKLTGNLAKWVNENE
ncbi:hypothetical protein [Vibrio splendidus]|uniref:Uncharacterized protein n=1 Tax=Vibrio splendidus 12E03 TaxID=1191305 RepID=A0A1E5FCX4_VIBSP|nr:hypothetical protein [Vibrio splendidus]OEF86399.1 hypothetical protein A142_11025 [Vibrio splendidus 12E03]